MLGRGVWKLRLEFAGVFEAGSTLVEGFHLGRNVPDGSLPVLGRLAGRAPGLTEGDVAFVALATDCLPERPAAGSLERKGKYESRLRVEPAPKFAGAGGFSSSEILLVWAR